MAEGPDNPKESNLTGNYFIRRLGSANDDVERLFRRTRDRIEIRRQALKLRYLPARAAVGPSGQLIDIDWSYIKSLPNLRIGELRIHDTIGGHDNLRIIFFVGPPSDLFPMTCIWVLSVFQKKRDDFTSAQIRIFRAKREIVLARFYRPGET
jgi:hypothetical protein